MTSIEIFVTGKPVEMIIEYIKAMPDDYGLQGMLVKDIERID